MKAVEIKPGIYSVGATDWNVRNFHGYKTQKGTSYNAYLILDDRVTLIDTVKESHSSVLINRIKRVIDPAKIDLVVANHVEMDHSGGLSDIIRLAPNAEVVASTKGVAGLKRHYDTTGWKMTAVKSGEKIALGKRTLEFIHTPMLHWPDSMVTYIESEGLLLPNDAFGQHIATDSPFDDGNPLDVVMVEAAKYYANIVYPFGRMVQRTLNALKELKIEVIAPSHGVIWRKNIADIIAKYEMWAEGGNREKALIVYDSMWGSTEAMAHAIECGFLECGIPTIVRNLKHNHISDVMTDLLESKYIAIGSPTLNNLVLPSVAGFLNYIQGLAPKNKVGFAFGSYGWSSMALKQIEEVMAKCGWCMPLGALNINYRPDEEALTQLKTRIGELVG